MLRMLGIERWDEIELHLIDDVVVLRGSARQKRRHACDGEH